MDKDREPPFRREPWQRLLQDRGDMPPETTDARIRAQAQKAVAPRAARWWLPASLAASFLIAVLVVQLQYGREEKSTVVTEADLAAPTASAPSAAAEAPSLARDSAAESPAAAKRESTSSELHYEMAPEDFAVEPETDSGEQRAAANSERISGPEQERKAASEMDAEVINPPAPPPAESAPLSPERTPVAGSLAEEAAAPRRSPEAWYADIEALRKAGRNKEADAELARFEAAYPDWLEKNHLLNR